MLLCLLLVGCGKPIKENETNSEPTIHPDSFILRALRSYNPVYTWDGSLQTREIGWYDVPVEVKSVRTNHRPGWVHIDHDSTKFCYEFDGIMDYRYNHHRGAKEECSDPRGRETRKQTFFITWRVPVFLRIEDNCDASCGTVEVEVIFVKHASKE